MDNRILVVARADAVINKFEQSSIRDALNIKDFLEQTGEYQEVLIFQRVGVVGPMGEWVEMASIEC